MKPEHLKLPFTWEEKHIIVSDRVWYVPENYKDYHLYQFPGWNDSQFFGNDNPVCVEYCSGNGAWIAAKAQAEPHKNWVAIERKFARVKKIWSKAKNMQLTNLFIVCGEALSITKNYFSDSSINEVYINFPDPWPKRKHAKNRLMQKPFIEELYRSLEIKGTCTFVTDDIPYSQQTIYEMNDFSGMSSIYPEPYFLTDFPNYGTSYFEELWRGKGLQIHYHKFCKDV